MSSSKYKIQIPGFIKVKECKEALQTYWQLKGGHFSVSQKRKF